MTTMTAQSFDRLDLKRKTKLVIQVPLEQAAQCLRFDFQRAYLCPVSIAI